MRASVLRVVLGAAVLAAVLVPAPAQAVHVTYSSSTSVPIPDTTGPGCAAGLTTSATSTITVPDGFEVGDLDVELHITHSWIGDLIVELTSPEGTTVTLVERIGRGSEGCGSSEDDIVTRLDDDAPTPIVDYASTVTPPHAPTEPLSAFNGEAAGGEWTLTVYDVARLNDGSLDFWALHFASGPARLAVDDISVGERDDQVTFTVARSGSLIGTDTVDYATADGTATAGEDYAATAGTLTFAPGVASLEVTVPILDDGLLEGDETFTLQLTNPTGDPVPTITTAAGTATIVDDEAPEPTTPTTAAPEPTTPTTAAPAPAAPRAQAVTAPPTYAG